MKAFYFFVFLIPFLSFSQITLNVSDFSDGGDTIRMSNNNDFGINFSATGQAYNWDYSSLIPTTQTLLDYNDMSNASFLINFMYGNFAAPDYQASNYISSSAVPLDQMSTFLPVNISDVFQFSKNSSDSITSIGFALSVDGNEIPFKSDTIETRYKFPLNYGDSYSSRGYSELDMNPFYNGIWKQYRQRSSVVDGWGFISTPYGTFDVIRIDHFITEIDSLFIDAFGGFWVELPIPDSHVYEWWANGEKEPILRINTSDIAGNETATSVEYRDIYRGLDAGLEEENLAFVIYPNPSDEFIRVEGIQFNTKFTIVSNEGKIVLEGGLEANKSQIDIADLPSGRYTIILSQNNATGTSSFVKK